MAIVENHGNCYICIEAFIFLPSVFFFPFLSSHPLPSSFLLPSLSLHFHNTVVHQRQTPQNLVY